MRYYLLAWSVIFLTKVYSSSDSHDSDSHASDSHDESHSDSHSDDDSHEAGSHDSHSESASDSHEEGSHDSHDSHEDSHEFEYAGMFTFETGETYTMILDKVNGLWSAPSVKVVFLAGSGDLEAKSAVADHLFEELEEGHLTPVQKVSGDSFVTGEVIYELTLQQNSFTSTFLLNCAADGAHFIFMEHGPGEFENGGHWLRDDHGHDMVAVSEIGHDHSDHEETKGGLRGDKLWWLTMVGTLIGCAASLLAVCIVSYGFEIFADDVWMNRLCKGTAGVLMGVVTMHLLGEAAEHAGGWPHNLNLGLSLSFGLFLTMLIETLTHAVNPYVANTKVSELEVLSPKNKNGTVELTVPSKEGVEYVIPDGGTKTVESLFVLSPGVGYASIVGDAFHNFFDGVLIASSFSSCSTSLGWTVSVAILIHELPQEVADFIVLRRSGWSVVSATCANVGVSVTAIIGAIVYLTMLDEFSLETQGYLLAVSAGVFFSVGFELLSVGQAKAVLKDRLIHLFMWSTGLLSMYFLMYWHPVCEASHDSHNH